MNLDTTKMNLGVYLDLTLVVVSTFTGGWSDDWRVMLNSTPDQIKLKLKFELSLAKTEIIFKNFLKIDQKGVN